MNILTLDLAQSTGWAHSCGQSGVQSFHPRRGDSPGMQFVEFQSWLRRFLDLQPTSLVVYEQAPTNRRNAASVHIAHGYISALEMVQVERGFELTSRSVSAIKLFALPHIKKQSDRNKQQMVMYVENHWPSVRLPHRGDDDQADAIILLWMILIEMGITDTEWHRRRVEY